MTWTYQQSTGELTHDGEKIATGYSGLGVGKNNPAMQDVAGVGPIPLGVWAIGGMVRYDAQLGPYVMGLSQSAGDSFGRSAFFIHGDSVAHPGAASHGCIILDRATRLMIADSHDPKLIVVA